MEIWILILVFAFGFVIGRTIIEIYEVIQMNRWHLRLAMRKLEHPEFLSRTHDVSKALNKQKVGTVTGTVGYEQLEEMGATLNEAERLIKEARDRTIN